MIRVVFHASLILLLSARRLDSHRVTPIKGEADASTLKAEVGTETASGGGLLETESQSGLELLKTKSRLEVLSVRSFDKLTLLYVLLGGFFMGTYPVPIKAPSVVSAQAHPIVFQWYKSVSVFLVGWSMVYFNYLMTSTTFALNWWAVASSLMWVPGGLCNIAAVPRLGVAAAMVTGAGTASLVSFLIGWLVLGERMKVHVLDGHRMSFAPLYLFLIIVGMATLVAVPHANTVQGELLLQRLSFKAKVYGSTPSGGPGQAPLAGANVSPGQAGEFRCIVFGLAVAILAGCFAAFQVTAVAFGRKTAETNAACDLNDLAVGCPVALVEAFNTFGSWTASFGLGAFVFTNVALALIAWLQEDRSAGMSFKQLAGPGCIGGACWVLGALFQTAAVAQGGAAVIMPANCTVTLVTSGLWGLLYYREVKDFFSGFIWIVAAFATMAAAMALFQERAN